MATYAQDRNATLYHLPCDCCLLRQRFVHVLENKHRLKPGGGDGRGDGEALV
jgi:hypothetical protein